MPGHLNQANYAQFAAAIAQQAARQRQAQEVQLAQAQQQVPLPPSCSASILHQTHVQGLPIVPEFSTSCLQKERLILRLGEKMSYKCLRILLRCSGRRGDRICRSQQVVL